MVKAHLALLFANMLFGLNFALFSSIIKNWLTFGQLFYARIFFSALVFIPLIASQKRYKLDFEDFLRILTTTVLIIFGKQYLMLWGVAYTVPVDASILATLAPVITLSVSSFFVKEKLHLLKVLGIAMATSGVLIMLFFDGVVTHQTAAFGNLLIFLSTISAATNTILIKPALMKLSTIKVMGWYYIIGLVITTPLFYDDILTVNLHAISVQGWIDIAWVLALGTALPNYLLYYGTEKATSVHTALYFYAQPVMAFLLSFFRGQPSYNESTLLGGLLIIVSIFLIIASYKKYSFPKIRWQDFDI